MAHILLPDGSYLEIPEGMTPDQAYAKAKEAFPEKFGQAQAAAPAAEPESGFFAGLKSGIENLKGDIGAIGAGMGVKGAEEYAAAQRKKAEGIYKQAAFSEHPIDYLTGLAGQSLPYMAAPIAAGIAGSYGAPLLLGAGATEAALGTAAALGSMTGAGLTSATQFTGSNLSRQLEEGTKGKDLNVLNAVAASIPQAALDTVSMRMIPGIQRIFGAAGKELSEQAAAKIVRDGIIGTTANAVKSYGPTVLKTMGTEGLTEAAQQVLERAQAGLSITDEKAREEYFDNFMGGAALGGVFAVPGHAFEKSRARDKYAKEAEAKAAADKAAADAEEQQRRAQPEYLLNLADQHEQLKQQIDAVQEQLKANKPAKNATDEEKEAYAQLQEQRKALIEQFKPLNAELAPRKAELAAVREQQRLAGMSPQDVFMENIGVGEESKPAAQGNAATTMEDIAAANAAAPAATVDPIKQALEKHLEGLNYFNQLDVPNAVSHIMSDPLLAQQVVANGTNIDGLSGKENKAVQGALKLQLKQLGIDIAAGRKEAAAETSAKEATQEKVQSETDALQRIAARPNPVSTTAALTSITNALTKQAEAKAPAIPIQEGLQKQNYRAIAAEHADTHANALFDLNNVVEDIARGRFLNSANPVQRKLASSTREGLANQAETLKHTYINGVLQEAAHARAAENMQPLTTDQASKAAVKMNMALEALIKRSATPESITRALEVTRAQLLTDKPALQRVETPVRGQSASLEAKKVAEASGETATTLEGELRRKRDYVGNQIEQALAHPSITPEVSAALGEVQQAIDNGTATRETLDAAGDAAHRVLLGKDTTDAVKPIRESLRTTSDVQTDTSGQRDLFGNEEKGTIRATPENFKRLLNSKKIADLRKAIADVKKALAQAVTRGAPAGQLRRMAEKAKLTDKVSERQRGILESVRDLTKDIRAQRANAIYGPIIERFETRVADFENQLAAMRESIPETGRADPELDSVFEAIEKVQDQIAEGKRAVEELKQRQAGSEKETDSAAKIAAMDERIQKERAKLDEDQKKLDKIDTRTYEQRVKEQEAKKQRADLAVAEKKLADLKAEEAKRAEAQQRRIQSGEGLSGVRRTTEPVFTQNVKTGERVAVVEKETGEQVRQKVTRPILTTKETVEERAARMREEAQAAAEERRQRKEKKANTAPAAENIADFASTARTLARQEKVTDVAPRPKRVKPLRTALAPRDAASSFARADPIVKAARRQYGTNSPEHKRAIAAATQKFFDKLVKESYTATSSQADFGEDVFRMGEVAESGIDAAEAQTFIDKVKAALPEGVKFIYAPTIGHLPGKLLVRMAERGLDVHADKLKGAVMPDGTVVVVGDTHATLADLEQTVAHELVGHYGIDTLLGEKGMKSLLDAVDKHDGGMMGLAEKMGIAEHVNEVAVEYAIRYETAKKEGASKEDLAKIQQTGRVQAMRELIAHVEESRPTASFMQNAKRFIQEMVGAVRAALRKMGFAELSTASTSDIYYMLRQSRESINNKTIGAYRNPNGEIGFRRRDPVAGPRVSADIAATVRGVVGHAPTDAQKIFANVTGIGARTALVDRFAPLKHIAENLKDTARGMQMMYYARMHDQRMSWTQQTVSGGAPKLSQDSKGNYIIKSGGGSTLSDVVKTLSKVKGLGNTEMVRDTFTAYLAAHRAARVGVNRLNFSGDITQAALDDVRKLGDSIPEFVEARKQYNEYNKGLVNWLIESGAMSKEEGAKLAATNDYVPFYRVNGEEVQFDIGDRKPITIGNLKSQPYLHELVGGDKKIQDIFTSSLQNTALLVDMGLKNLATKDVAFTLQSAGLLDGVENEKTGKTRGILKGQGPADDRVIRFKIDGVPYYAKVDTKSIGLPSELVVQGMHGVSTTLGGFVKMMSIPARFMRTAVTRNPTFAMRQIVRDSLSNYMLAGGDMTPVMSSLKEVGKMFNNKSEGEKKLQERGVIGGQIISGTSEDMRKILLQLTSGKGDLSTLLAKADRIAMKADASSRVALYNSYIKQGMSDMEATLAALESMNFSKRGTSGTVYKLNMMVPFVNAQIQGLNVLYEAMTGKLPYADRLRVQKKLFVRGAMMAGMTLAYAAMMDGDDGYENASQLERLQNWFIRIPGLSEAVRVPIPFEAGLIFKALPEAALLASKKDADGLAVAKALGQMLASSSPVGLSSTPQMIKPILEASLNKSFFTGRDIESAQEQELLPSERTRAGTSELAKVISQATAAAAQSAGIPNGGVSPVMVEHLISGYTGGIGIAFMQAANAILPPNKEAASKRLSETPIIGSLFQPNDASGQISQFYDNAKIYTETKKSYEKMLKEGRAADAAALLQKYSNEIALASAADKIKHALGQITTAEKMVRASDLSATEKRERLDEYRKMKIQITQAFRSSTTSFRE